MQPEDLLPVVVVVVQRNELAFILRTRCQIGRLTTLSELGCRWWTS